MNDLLDDRLRTMMRTATADAPEAPTVDDLQVITVVSAEPRRRSLRPIAAAAAVMAVAAAGALVWWPSGNGGPQPADTPDSTEAGVVPGSYLDAYYLPTELPDGWQIVEMGRYTNGPVGYVGDSAVFETRDGAGLAALYLTEAASGEVPASTEAALDPAVGSDTASEPVPTSASDALWEQRDRWLTWNQDGRSVVLTPADGQEATARSLAADLIAIRDGDRVRFRVDEDAAWVQTAEYLLDGQTIVTGGANWLQLADDDGTVHVGIERPIGLGLSDAAAPIPGVEDVFSTTTINRMVVRAVGEIEITAFSPSGSASVDELVSLLKSFEPVSEEEWLAARPDANEVVAGATVVGTFELLDHTVNAHREGGISGVCVERSDGVSGCSLLPGVGLDGELPPAAPTEGIRLSDGSWVAVGSIANGLEPCDEPLLQGARMAAVPNGDVQTMLVVPADLDQSFTCPLTGIPDGPPTGAEMFIANPPLADD
ncbi:MAG: hypothetical protein F2534_19605 [Actinobacteria bacterium]|uniref:Unannotated protein n=1 Tax=freshwater metagenome TaxID=449393 RepID=A0A6J6FT14_9ZZZZ|nr:hypothetical protein [Actinomycetota bacterium]